MADGDRKVTVSHLSHDEDTLPFPPPPPPVPPRPLDYEGPLVSGGTPVLPPKESFSTFYQLRQKSELKRLFKHIHPELRASLDHAVDEDIMKEVCSQSSHAEDSYQGEVQSMRWIFENWTLDNIGDPHATKKLLNEEDLQGGDVRGTSSMFEHIDNSQQTSALAKRQSSVRGDVRTSTWLFETQPLDSLNASRCEKSEVVEALLKEPIPPGDVRGTRLLFESTPLSNLGRYNSVEDHSFLKLRSEVQEQKGDVQKTVKLFQAEPCCAIRDNSGNVHEIKSICREEINSSNISTARWLFETQPLDLISKGSDQVKMIRGISLEEGPGVGMDRKRWMFETQPFDTIQDVTRSNMFEETRCSTKADVENKTKFFEMHPLSTLKGDSAEKIMKKDEIIGGDVKTSLWLFETQPMEALDDNYEVGRLKKISLAANEQGEVRGKKQMFESCSIQRTTSFKEQDIEKGDVKRFKHLFETIPLSQLSHSDEEIKDTSEKDNAITVGNVKDNRVLFETTPLYAIKDSSGYLHEVTAVSREEFIKGKVQNYKWMFDTKPLDQLVEGKSHVEVIKGITRQEDTMGDVKMAKWLFETQTIDGIHSKFNQTQESSSGEEELHQGAVKTCKWLFETQPVDILYDKTHKVNDKEAIDSTNVKSFTWLFESQPLDNIKDCEEYNLKLCSTVKDSVKSEVGVQMVKHLFETETLDRIQKDAKSEQDMRCISQVDLQSGDVSRVKELFESKSLDEIGSEMVSSDAQNQDEHIEKGSVNKFTWMFENRPMNMINKDETEENAQNVSSVASGDVQRKKFIFETSSLDKIHEEDLEQKSVCVEKPVSSVDVKSSTMMFESLPLYAIRDKEGQFHEVTTVKKEEVMSTDVRGARWMFETKPLDAIKAENEVYVIRAVTQEDVKKGDVKSARWKFETQPLDTFTNQHQPSIKVIEDLESGNVQLSKQIFESEQSSKKFVRMVSVTDVQQGDVRTSTWLFENQSIDSLKGEPQEHSPVKPVHREDTQKGDVKRCTWLFESQPLDKIKKPDTTAAQGIEDEIPKADVKCTTWLFETTPLDQISANSVVDTLSYLHQRSFIHSSGIIIEASESKNVNMAKYLCETSEGVKIQKEEVVGGNIKNIMLQLLLKPTLIPQVTLLREMEEGKMNIIVVELPVYQTTLISLERDSRIQNTVQMIEELLTHNKDFKKGIIMQETEDGQAEMSVYSLICHSETRTESQVIERGDVKSTIGNLLATANTQKTATSCRVDEIEKGNVNLYKSCIEKGDLHSLKRLQYEAAGDEVDHSFVAKDQIEIVQGDVREAKRSLCQQKEQVERTISDVLPGDVKNTKKVFSSECSFSVESCIPKEEIVRGDVNSAKQQLTAKQPIMIEKEEIVAGDIKATMESLERAKQQSMAVEREIIKPGTIYDMDLSQAPETEGSQAQKEVIISGDVKAAKKSLEIAKQQSMHVEREALVPGKIYNLNISAQEETTSTVTPSPSSSRCQQIKTKVSDAVNNQENHVSFETCQQSAVLESNGATESLPPFLSYECNEDETGEVIRGDIKATIKSLQSAAAVHKHLDKEDIVRGNVQLALQSLEKSSVNVSKGDFKAAMIYRNSGRACSGRSKTVHKQGIVMSVPPSDTNLSPSISVTGDEHPSITTQNSTPIQNGNSMSSSSETPFLPPLPQNIDERRDERRTLLPKGQWTKYVVVEEQNIPESSSEVISANVKQRKSVHVSFADTSQQTTHSKASQTHDQKICQEAAKDLNQTRECPERTNYRCNISKKDMVSNTAEVEMERNVKQKINAAEEIQLCMKNYAEESKQEMNISLQATLQNFERKGNETVNKRGPSLFKKVKSINKAVSQTPLQEKLHPSPLNKQNKTDAQTSESNHPTDTFSLHQNNHTEKQENIEGKVVLREKKGKETEAERRQRLSVHKEEIMKGNVMAAMEIFENLRKREELKGILSQVEEIEGESNSPLKTLSKDVPQSRNAKESKTEEKKVEVELQDDDLESISSVETAFEDLEKASKEIMHLKQETLAKLLDIEEAIKKALYSVSNLKSEADIAGLSGLFDESLKSEQSLQPSNNIRKISIGSSKTKPGQSNMKIDMKSPAAAAKEAESKPLPRQSSSQSSPSFISIHSASRNPAEKSLMSTFKPKTQTDTPFSYESAETSKKPQSPTQRKVSVLQVQTLPEKPAGIFGTKTVSETYEETDGFGNVFLSSTTSTVVTKQSDSKTPALFQVVENPARYQVMSSPQMRRSGRPFEDQVLNKPKEDGTVFVTFSQPVEKH